MSTVKVYLDYNATTPLHPDLWSFVKDHLSKFGNPSSVHWAGRESKRMITAARENIASFVKCDPLEIIFTSGGSESNNLALKGALYDFGSRREIVCSRVEHPSILKTMEFLKNEGYQIHWLNVSKGGLLDLDQLRSVVSEKTALVTVQLVNNETGNIFPIKEVAQIAHAHGALVHSDMVQGLGKIPVDLQDLGVDLASFAGHKFYSLKGAGFLFAKKGVHLEPLVHGGGQERNRRAGTENALAISCLGEAVRLLGPQMTGINARVGQFRGELEEKILKTIQGARVNGASGPRAPNTLNVTFDNVDGETLLINLDTRGFAVSSGAACSSGSQEPSPVLTAMGYTAEEASQSLRISLGWLTTPEEIAEFYSSLVTSVKHMRDIQALNTEAEI